MTQEQVTDLTSEAFCFRCLFSSGEALVGLKGEQAVWNLAGGAVTCERLSEVGWDLVCRTLPLGRLEGSGVADRSEPSMEWAQRRVWAEQQTSEDLCLGEE